MKKIPHHKTTHDLEKRGPTNSPHFIAKHNAIGMEYSFGQWVSAASELCPFPISFAPDSLLMGCGEEQKRPWPI